MDSASAFLRWIRVSAVDLLHDGADAFALDDAQDVAAYMHEDPSRWSSIKESLPLLSKRYYTLHRNIWEDSRPRAGWFRGSKETVAYVENVMEYYDEYRALLN